MKYYIAAGLKHYELVENIEEYLMSRGHEITHRWTQEYRNELATNKRISNDKELGKRCIKGIIDANVLGLIVKGKTRGAHIEYGVAIGASKKVVVYCPDPVEEISMYQNVTYCLCDFVETLLGE